MGVSVSKVRQDARVPICPELSSYEHLVECLLGDCMRYNKALKTCSITATSYTLGNLFKLLEPILEAIIEEKQVGKE